MPAGKSLAGEKLEIVTLVKVRALKGLHRDPGAPRERHGVDGELRHGVRLLGRVGLVVQDVKISGAELHNVDVAGDGLLTEGEGKAAGLEIGEVLRGQVDGHFHGNRGRVVEQHVG
jgi:hypothetical protein